MAPGDFPRLLRQEIYVSNVQNEVSGVYNVTGKYSLVRGYVYFFGDRRAKRAWLLWGYNWNKNDKQEEL